MALFNKDKTLTKSESRKKSSEKKLKMLKAEFLESLPLIEDSDEVNIRSSEEIYKRIFCLISVAALVGGIEKKKLVDWLNNEQLYGSLSPEEKELFEKTEITKRDKIKFSWRAESAWCLLQVAGIVPLQDPIKECNIQEMLSYFPDFGTDTKSFLVKMRIINKEQILDFSDFLYRAHWTTRQNSIDNKTRVGNLCPGVVSEWHLAVNWVTNYDDGAEWDNVGTDT
jgi:hypothetical protein